MWQNVANFTPHNHHHTLTKLNWMGTQQVSKQLNMLVNNGGKLGTYKLSVKSLK